MWARALYVVTKGNAISSGADASWALAGQGHEQTCLICLGGTLWAVGRLPHQVHVLSQVQVCLVQEMGHGIEVVQAVAGTGALHHLICPLPQVCHCLWCQVPRSQHHHQVWPQLQQVQEC